MSDADLPPLRAVIEQFGLQAKKSLGQHFLLDPQLLAKIVRAAGDLTSVQVIEVGPGPGGLTRAILDAGARHLIAIERDRRCIAALQDLTRKYPDRFTLIEADALKREITALGEAPRVIVANLPYNIGTELVTSWLETMQQSPASLSGFTVMLQREVAQRLCAQVGDAAYGRLSLLAQACAQIHPVLQLPAAAFTPPPKVESSVLRATPLPAPAIRAPLADFSAVVASAFNHRRKMLRQSLKSLGVDPIALCAAAQIDPTARAETCTLAMFDRLALAWRAAVA